MRKNNNTIEINGQLYDARTGSLMTSAAANSGRPAAPQPSTHTATPAKPDVVRQPGKRPSGRAPSPPQTLMRHAVKKPSPSLKRQHKVQGQAALVPQTLDIVAPSPSLGRINEKRLRRAKQIPRSHMISHFPSLMIDSQPSPPRESAISLPRRPANHATAKTQAAQAVPAESTNATTKLLNGAIERATSHLQPPPPKSRHARFKRRASMGSAVGLSVMLLGLIVVQNATNVRLQMASAKAGFDVSLPGYRPAGFALGKLNYSFGTAATQFSGPSGSRHYTITQKQSSWDNQALLNNFVAADYANYQTISTGDRVIYIYGDHDATWVNNGVWYVVRSDGALSDQQLIDLATSL